MKSGIFLIAPLSGPVAERVLEVQRWADPRMAAGLAPHITLVGSSGVGPMPIDTPLPLIRELLEPIAADTQPLTLQFQRPHRFMQTEIVVLPLDPYGALRTLHERIASSGLRFESPRFTFSPHCTLSFYPTLTVENERKLMALRVDEPVVIERLEVYHTPFPQPSRKILELTLGQGVTASA